MGVNSRREETLKSVESNEGAEEDAMRVPRHNGLGVE